MNTLALDLLLRHDAPSHYRYWLESANGGCGWLPAADLETPKL